jgi:hypothetical protein
MVHTDLLRSQSEPMWVIAWLAYVVVCLIKRDIVSLYNTIISQRAEFVKTAIAVFPTRVGGPRGRHCRLSCARPLPRQGRSWAPLVRRQQLVLSSRPVFDKSRLTYPPMHIPLRGTPSHSR